MVLPGLIEAVATIPPLADLPFYCVVYGRGPREDGASQTVQG